VTPALFAIPGDLATLTGGYGYDRRMLAALPTCGVDAQHLPLPGGFPFADAATVAESLRLLGEAPPDHVLLVDGLALGALPPDGLAGLAAPLVALVHHPLGLESGLAPATARALIENERAVLAHVRHVIVTSQTTRDTLIADFGMAATRITVAEPGTDPAPRFQGSGGQGVALLAIGSITPRKGHGVLVEALAGLAHLPWSLTIIGSPDRDPACAAGQRKAAPAAKPLVASGRRKRPLARPMRAPTSSCCPLYMRAMAWCWARPWRGACPSSRPQAAPPRRPSPTPPPSRFPPAMRWPCARPCNPPSLIPPCARASPTPHGWQDMACRAGAMGRR
jgi:hypothetical protein